ncbi:MAG TPA: alpha/beta hydrolase [Longimicrobiales bacterium]|nr:alpha/beta hydrolase [Longimicrobiales bacterium]
MNLRLPSDTREASIEAARLEQDIRFTTASDGVRIAYATTGDGPPLVKAANWLSHLEYDLQSPVWRHWLRELSREHMLLRYDERGCGLSDWDVADHSHAAWVRDLEAVVDAAGLERFDLLGISQGGPVAIAYTVLHPERVKRLVLYGAYARGWHMRGASAEEIAEREAQITLSEHGWGRDVPAYREMFTRTFIPDATEEQRSWFNELQRITCSPANAVRLQRALGAIDVSELLPRVSVPTLVLHGRGDMRCPFEEGRALAATIPNSRFVSLDSRNHLLLEEEPAWREFLREVRGFLGVSTTESPAVAAAAETESSSFLRRLRDRKLAQWTVAYAGVAWLLLQVLGEFREPWHLPDGLLRGIQVALLGGLFATLVIAWFHGERGNQRAPLLEIALLAGVLALTAFALVLAVG